MVNQVNMVIAVKTGAEFEPPPGFRSCKGEQIGKGNPHSVVFFKGSSKAAEKAMEGDRQGYLSGKFETAHDLSSMGI